MFDGIIVLVIWSVFPFCFVGIFVDVDDDTYSCLGLCPVDCLCEHFDGGVVRAPDRICNVWEQAVLDGVVL